MSISKFASSLTGVKLNPVVRVFVPFVLICFGAIVNMIAQMNKNTFGRVKYDNYVTFGIILIILALVIYFGTEDDSNDSDEITPDSSSNNTTTTTTEKFSSKSKSKKVSFGLYDDTCSSGQQGISCPNKKTNCGDPTCNGCLQKSGYCRCTNKFPTSGTYKCPSNFTNVKKNFNATTATCSKSTTSGTCSLNPGCTWSTYQGKCLVSLGWM